LARIPPVLAYDKLDIEPGPEYGTLSATAEEESS